MIHSSKARLDGARLCIDHHRSAAVAMRAAGPDGLAVAGTLDSWKILIGQWTHVDTTRGCMIRPLPGHCTKHKT